MLDKTVPYYKILFMCDKEIIRSISAFPPPEGFSFRPYEGGRAREWAEIEASVGEFASVAEGIEFFSERFLPYEELLKERCLFIVDDNGSYAATAMAWCFPEDGERRAILHWIGVKPEYQKMGLGRAVISGAMSLFNTYEPGKHVYLKTQTWSYRAIELYLKLGFRALRFSSFGGNKNEYEYAVKALKGRMRPEMYEQFINTALD